MIDWARRPDDVTIIDVRTPAEFETMHIPGSYNVPVTLLAEDAAQFAARLDRKVVLVCQSGARASQARLHLAGVGAQNLHILDGGVPALPRPAVTWCADARDGPWTARSAWQPARWS